MPLDPNTIHPFVVRPDVIVRVETETLIEASRQLLKETQEMAEDYRSTKAVKWTGKSCSGSWPKLGDVRKTATKASPRSMQSLPPSRTRD
jgi:hypothetical protein